MKMKILIGTLMFEDGIFQKGDIVEVSAERFATLDKSQVEAVPEPIIIQEPAISQVALIEENPLPKTRKKTSVTSDVPS